MGGFFRPCYSGALETMSHNNLWGSRFPGVLPRDVAGCSATGPSLVHSLWRLARLARYLVTGEYVDPGPLLPPQQVVELVEHRVIPSFEALAQLETQKKILAGGIFAGGRAGAFIVDVASNDELNRLLQELPFWGLIKWVCTPLQGYRERAADEQAALDRIKASLA